MAIVAVSPADLVGSAGVTILLGAFVLNLFGRLGSHSRRYILMNAVGAGLAAVASAMIHYPPFVVLEGTWCLAAIARLCTNGKRSERE